MAFAISLVLRGGQAARQALVAIKDGVLGVASAERRLAADTAQAATQQDRLAAAARKAHQELKSAAAAFRAQSVATGVDRLTGARTGAPGQPFGSAATQRVAALMSLQRQGRDDWAEMLAGRGAPDKKVGRIGAFLQKAAPVASAAGSSVGSTIASFGAASFLAPVALGAIAVGLALDNVSKEIERQKVGIARIADLGESLRQGMRSMAASADQTANATAKPMQSSIAALIAGGNLDKAKALSLQVGPQAIGAAGTLQQARLFDNPKVVEAMKLAVGTGQIDAQTFSRTIASKRGLAGAGSPEAIAKSVLAQNGIYGVDVKKAGAAFGGSALGKAYAGMDSAEAHLQDKALARFASGSTTGGIREEAGRVASPETAAQVEWKRALDQQVAIMTQQYEKQTAFYAVMDGLINRGDSLRVSIRRTTEQNNEATPVAFNPNP